MDDEETAHPDGSPGEEQNREQAARSKEGRTRPRKLFGRYQEVVLLLLGFVLTTLVGTYLADGFQTAQAARERQSRREEADLQKATQLYEETSRSASQIIVRTLSCDRSLWNAEIALERYPERLKKTTGFSTNLDLENTTACKSMAEARDAWLDLEVRVGPLIEIYFPTDVIDSFKSLKKTIWTGIEHASNDLQAYANVRLMKPDFINLEESERLREVSTHALNRFSEAAAGRLRGTSRGTATSGEPQAAAAKGP